MADTTLELDPGSGGATLAVDDIGGAVHQYTKVEFGGSGSATAVSNANPLPTKITDGTDTALVTAAGELTVSLTTALPAGTAAIGKLAANDGVDIGDVDVTSFPATVHSADFDTGGGTDTTMAFGIAVPANGGAAVIPGDATAGLKVNLGADNDVTVTSGTVTAELSATDNAVLDAIAASVAAIDTDTTTLIGHVDGVETLIGTTNTTLTTIDGRVDGIEGLLTTIDGDTGNIATAAAAIQTASEAIQAAVEGTLTVTGGGGGTEYTEDAAAAANPVGNALIVIREDGRAGSLTTTDGDNVALRGNNFGELYVKHTDTIAVTQSGTWDEVGINDSGNSITVDDGGVTLSIDDGGGVITVDGTVAVTNAGLTELAAAINASSQMDVNIAASGATVPVSNAGITTIAGAVSGAEMQVDVVAALPSGANTIGNVRITDGTDTADVLDLSSSNPLAVAIVDGSGDQITSFGGGTQYTVNAVVPGDPVGTAMVMERDDQLSTVTEAEGDWTNARGTAKGALWVAIADSAGDPITSFGGGTQYTEADTDASITGTAILWEDTSDTLRAVSAAKPLPVTVISQVQPVGASNIATGQAAPTSSAATLVSSRATRTRLTLVNRGSVSVYVGPATVSTSNGVELKPGESMTFEMAGTTLQGITASGTGNIHYWEEYN